MGAKQGAFIHRSGTAASQPVPERRFQELPCLELQEVKFRSTEIFYQCNFEFLFSHVLMNKNFQICCSIDEQIRGGRIELYNGYDKYQF